MNGLQASVIPAFYYMLIHSLFGLDVSTKNSELEFKRASGWKGLFLFCAESAWSSYIPYGNLLDKQNQLCSCSFFQISADFIAKTKCSLVCIKTEDIKVISLKGRFCALSHRNPPVEWSDNQWSTSGHWPWNVKLQPNACSFAFSLVAHSSLLVAVALPKLSFVAPLLPDPMTICNLNEILGQK